MGRNAVRSMLVALALALACAPAAQAGTEDEAARQVELAEEDLAAGNFERAAASAASALRLDPARTDALVVRALALKGLGRLEDAAGLLRAYRDLRGTLPLDERVEPALAELARLSAPEPEEPEEPAEEAPGVIDGPVTVVFTPEADERASERAYAAARPLLGGTPAKAILSLELQLPREDGLVVLGAAATPCDGAPPAGSVADLVAAVEAAVVDLDPAGAAEAASTAEQALACGVVEPSAVARLLAARAAAHWVAGEPEVATRLWGELFAVQTDRVVDATLSPTAQALQLDAKLQGAEQPAQGELRLLLPKGWSAQVDGRAHEGGAVPAGRRIIRVAGPDGAGWGAVVEVERGGVATVATSAALRGAAREPRPDGAVLGWLAGQLAPLLEQGAQGVLLVHLGSDPAAIRHFDGQRFLLLTPAGRVARRGAVGEAAVPRGASAALLGGGLAVTAVGVIVAALAHREGEALRSEMGTASGWSDGYGAFESAVRQEQVGTGLAVGGGVLATAGGITFAIPQPKAQREVAAR